MKYSKAIVEVVQFEEFILNQASSLEGNCHYYGTITDKEGSYFICTRVERIAFIDYLGLFQFYCDQVQTGDGFICEKGTHICSSVYMNFPYNI